MVGARARAGATRAPGAASGTWKRGRLTARLATTRAAHSPSRARVAACRRPRRPSRTAATSSVEQAGEDQGAARGEERRRARPRARGAAGAMRLASTMSKAPARNGARRRRPGRRRSVTPLRRAWRRAAADGLGSMSAPTTRRGAEAGARPRRGCPCRVPTSSDAAEGACRGEAPRARRRQRRVVSWVPVPKARPGIDDEQRGAAGAPAARPRRARSRSRPPRKPRKPSRKRATQSTSGTATASSGARRERAEARREVVERPWSSRK